jgi:hypothetical protein
MRENDGAASNKVHCKHMWKYHSETPPVQPKYANKNVLKNSVCPKWDVSVPSVSSYPQTSEAPAPCLLFQSYSLVLLLLLLLFVFLNSLPHTC